MSVRTISRQRMANAKIAKKIAIQKSKSNTLPHGSVLARRNPILLLPLVGLLLMRPADRRSQGVLFQEPPRSTRLEQLEQFVNDPPSVGVLE